MTTVPVYAVKAEVLEEFRELQEVVQDMAWSEAADGGVLGQVLTSGKKLP